MTRGELLAAEAAIHIGVTNADAIVDDFRRALGNPAVGQSWCMDFVFYCAEKIAMPDLFRSQACLEVWNKSDPSLRLTQPEVGCVVIWQHQDGIHGHAGIVEKVLSESQIQTIEGNTSDSQGIDRSGGGVYRKVRMGHPVPTGVMVLKGFLRAWKTSETSSTPDVAA